MWYLFKYKYKYKHRILIYLETYCTEVNLGLRILKSYKFLVYTTSFNLNKLLKMIN